jgi:hypothetical protein
MAGTLL